MDIFEKYFNQSLRFLSFRPRSEKEVRDNLKKKKASPQIIEQIIQKLREQKFVNDSDFAKWWIESRTRFKPRSIKLIVIELKQKGIDKDILDKRINDNGLMINDLDQARELIKKKINRYKGLSKNELYQKLGGYLARRGFDWETIKQAIDEVNS